MPKIAESDILIVGGGLAGCTAAWYAAQAGFSVHLVEATPHLGGRVRSTYAEDVNFWIDNGQHVLSNGYHETYKILKYLGTDHLVLKQHKLQLAYQFNNKAKEQLVFNAWKLPAPLHLLMPLLVKMPISWQDRIQLLRWGISSKRFSESDLENMTVREWLECSGKGSKKLNEIFWQPLCLATLNGTIDQCCALLMSRVLNQAFLASTSLSGLGIPLGRLDQIFSDGFQKSFQRLSVRVSLSSTVRKAVIEANQFVALELRSGERLHASAAILATPRHVTERLLTGSCSFKAVDWRYSPIVTVYVRLRYKLSGIFPVSLPHSPLQWLFELPEQAFSGEGFGYAFVISGADELCSQSNEEIQQLALEESIKYATPDLSPKDFLGWKVIREKKATFLPTCSAQLSRPETETGIANVFLAGDWTATGLPATIEGAIISGKNAANSCNFLKK
ncbi:MAG: hydroxysqualene dehydroxylase HpnE [Calditrichia bacterium]